MCHMVADTREELIAMAEAIQNGYRRRTPSMSTSISRRGNAPKPSDTERSLSLPANSSENFDHEELHRCPDWDYMAIHEGSPEFECCTCDKAELR